MSDKKKNSKAKHARHAAPSEKESGSALFNSSLEADEEPLPPLDGENALSDQTQAMPQTMRPVPLGNAPDHHNTPSGFVPGGPMLPVDITEADPKRSRKPLKVLGIVMGVILALLAVVYIAGVVVLMDRFLPRTTIGEIDASLKSSLEVQSELTSAIDRYKLKVDGQGFSLSLSAAEAGVKIDATEITDAMHSSVNPWLWPVEITRSHDETDKLATSYNESGLGDKIRLAVEEFNKTATPPTNATIAFDATKNAFVVTPEAVGTALDYEAVLKMVDEAVATMEPTAKLTKEQLQKPTVLSTDAALKTAAEKANTMCAADLTLTMGGSVAGQVNATLLSQWITLGPDLSATLNEEALVAWVDKIAADGNTIGTERTYTRPDGKVISVAGGPYGWEVDRDTLLGLVKDGVATGKVATLEVPCTTTGNAYNGAGQRDWGSRYCDIDLSEQYVRFYDAAGALIWEAPCVTGTPNGSHNTPTGVFWLNRKSSPEKLKGTNLDGSKYESVVQYWMPFDGNVIGLHDADWQAAFGGSRYRDGFGSHGCVNLPPGKAAELYGIIQSGDVVVSHW